MYDDMLTATEVRKFYGAGALSFLQTMRVGLIVGPDRKEPNQHGGMTQLYRKVRVQEAALFMVKEVPADNPCRQAFCRGLFRMAKLEMTPEQEVYFQAGAAIQDCLQKPPEIRKPKRKYVNQVVTSARPRNLKAKNLLEW